MSTNARGPGLSADSPCDVLRLQIYLAFRAVDAAAHSKKPHSEAENAEASPSRAAWPDILM